MAKGSDFAMLVSDLVAVKKLPPMSGRADHDKDFEGDVLEIDLAPLLGLEPSAHRVLRLGNLNAVQLFQMSEANERLWKKKKADGWPTALCYDLSLLAAMHRSPDHQESGLPLLDLYGALVTRVPLRALYLYLVERVARAFPDIVRPEVQLEVYYSDIRAAQIAAGADPLEIEGPTEQELRKTEEELGILPAQERSPNG